MKRFLIPGFLLLHVNLFCQAQDTIRSEPSIHYNSKTDPLRGKAFASRAKYAREEIVFSPTHKKIDYCYYYDTERICSGDTYELRPDSILKINDQDWKYSWQGNSYYLSRYHSGIFESGYAKSLVPIERISPFATTTIDKKDTLWTADYSYDNPAYPYSGPKYFFHKKKLSGKVYSARQVDEAPAFLNGDSILTVKLARKDGCISEGYVMVRTMSFVITSEGRIVNIEQNMGNVDLDYCPYYIMELISHIYQLAPVKPAKRKGKPVNVKWIVKVDMDRGY